MGQPVEVPPGSADIVLPLPLSEQPLEPGEPPFEPPPIIE